MKEYRIGMDEAAEHNLGLLCSSMGIGERGGRGWGEALKRAINLAYSVFTEKRSDDALVCMPHSLYEKLLKEHGSAIVREVKEV